MLSLFLRSKSETLPEGETAALLAAAGNWYLDENMPWEAVNCFWQMRDYDRLVQSILQLPILRSPAEATNGMIEKLGHLPPFYRESNPLVDYCLGVLYLNGLRVKKAKETFLRLLSRLEPVRGEKENQTLLGNVHMALGGISLLENRQDGLSHVKRAAELLPNGCDIHSETLLSVRNNPVFFLPESSLNNDSALIHPSAHNATEPGAPYRDLPRGTATPPLPAEMQQMVDYHFAFAESVGRAANSGGLGFDLLFAAEAHFYAGDLSRALEYAKRAVYKAQPAGRHDIACNAMALQARIFVYQGKMERAAEALNEVEESIDQYSVPEISPLHACCRGWYDLCLGKTERASQWVRLLQKSNLGSPLEQGRDRLVCAQYQMANEDYAGAIDILLELDNVFQERGLWAVRLACHLLKAECYLPLRQAHRATAELYAAYQMAYKNGITTVFAERGERIVPLLEIAEKQTEAPFEADWLKKVRREAVAYSKRISGMIKNHGERYSVSKTHIPSLTDREKEVLRHLSSGLSREEIGAQMGITVHGVKKHITSIYTKLGAVNRVDALHIAFVSGLIPH
ncbi:LuxR C-terminal-related transcriptional regulator [Ruminococcaceae bacterium OttesenSCG-928-I18]|nr:LuxR C-terminal-related transcriptional regulator [Ruminococcaceae bacterium OttesenSCG-928-I18]